MPRLTREVRSPSKLVEMKSVEPTHFSDPESQRALTVAARAVAYALGREAARERFAELIGRAKATK